MRSSCSEHYREGRGGAWRSSSSMSACKWWAIHLLCQSVYKRWRCYGRYPWRMMAHEYVCMAHCRLSVQTMHMHLIAFLLYWNFGFLAMHGDAYASFIVCTTRKNWNRIAGYVISSMARRHGDSGLHGTDECLLFSFVDTWTFCEEGCLIRHWDPYLWAAHRWIMRVEFGGLASSTTSRGVEIYTMNRMLPVFEYVLMCRVIQFKIHKYAFEAGTGCPSGGA